MNESGRYLVISADQHVGPPMAQYRPYLRSDLRDEFDRWMQGHRCPLLDGAEALYGEHQWNSAVVQGVMDADGVAGALLLHGNSKPPFDGIPASCASDLPRTREEFDRRWAGLQAHNRWVEDFCKTGEAGRRRAGVLILPHDIDIALDEMRWAHRAGVFCAVNLLTPPPNSVAEPIYHTRYDPIWQLASEYGWPLLNHPGTGVPAYPMDQPATVAIWFAELVQWAQRPLLHMLLGGVFERFPRLSYLLVEFGPWDWALEVARRADGLAIQQGMVRGKPSTAIDDPLLKLFLDVGTSAVGTLSLLPSECFARQVYWGLSAGGVDPGVLARRHELGVDHILWGSDYPHVEGSTPQTRSQLRWALADVPDADRRQILGGTAARLLGFDTELLRPVAERIGPTPDDIEKPLVIDTSAAETANRQMMVAGVQRPFDGGAALYRDPARAAS